MSAFLLVMCLQTSFSGGHIPPTNKMQSDTSHPQLLVFHLVLSHIANVYIYIYVRVCVYICIFKLTKVTEVCVYRFKNIYSFYVFSAWINTPCSNKGKEYTGHLKRISVQMRNVLNFSGQAKQKHQKHSTNSYIIKSCRHKCSTLFYSSLRWSKPKLMTDSCPGKKPYVSSLLQKKTLVFQQIC